MTYINALKYLSALPKGSSNPERAKKVLHSLSENAKSLRSVHVCGIEGKESCIRMLSRIIRKNGYKVGCYVPDADDIKDAISINGASVSYDDFSALVKKVSMGYTSEHEGFEMPSHEEVLCLCALIHFADNECDLVILEKGMSKSDAVNVTDPPLVSVITSMSDVPLESVEFSDVLRRGTSETVTSPQHKDIYNAISKSCADIGSRLTLPVYSELEITKINLFKTFFAYRGKEYSVRSFSPFQTINAITVIEVASTLSRLDVNISEESIVEGIETATFPYKCEAISIEPTIIVSNAATPERFNSLIASIAQVKELITGDIFIAVDEACTLDTNKMLSSLATCNVIPKSMSLISRSLTPSKFTREMSDLISPLLSEENMSSALILIGEKDFANHISDTVRKVLGKVI